MNDFNDDEFDRLFNKVTKGAKAVAGVYIFVWLLIVTAMILGVVLLAKVVF